MRVAVVAFGDRARGDNGIGAEVLAALDRENLPADSAIIDGGTHVLKALAAVTGFDGLVIIDAASMGCPPGSCRIIGLDELVLGDPPPEVDFHSMRLDSHLFYAHKYLDLPPTRVVCIEPEILEGSGVSETLRTRIGSYVKAVATAVRGLAS